MECMTIIESVIVQLFLHVTAIDEVAKLQRS